MSSIQKQWDGFTIVELLVVIVVVGILAAITLVAFGGVRERAVVAQRESDAASLVKAIVAARLVEGKPLKDVTGSNYSLGLCVQGANNPSGIEPKNLAKTHACWTRYYTNLERLQAASGIDLSSLRSGDANGNPYMWDENEGEGTDNPLCRPDGGIRYFTGVGTGSSQVVPIPKFYPVC